MSSFSFKSTGEPLIAVLASVLAFGAGENIVRAVGTTDVPAV